MRKNDKLMEDHKPRGGLSNLNKHIFNCIQEQLDGILRFRFGKNFGPMSLNCALANR